MARFTALPVGLGDAFLLQREGRDVLVDGGLARHSLASTLSAHSTTRRLAVVICTHADADHAEGLIGLLEGNTVSVDEVWLPGRWSERLADLCNHPESFVYEAIRQAREADIKDLEAFGQALAASPDRESRDRRTSEPPRPEGPPPGGDMPTDPVPDVTHALDASTAHMGKFGWPWWPAIPAGIWVEVLAVAERIGRLARAAHNAGARLRWFDYEMATQARASSGGDTDLIPLNAVELTAPRVARRLRELEWLALSVANRESLVFAVPESATQPAVLFAGDSDLGFGLSLGATPTRSPVITAPHHGSEHNASAYGRLTSWLASPQSPPLLVRSDGRGGSRPGATYLGYNAKRFCTLCRGRPGKEPVVLEVDSGQWRAASNTRPCQCKP